MGKCLRTACVIPAQGPVLVQSRQLLCLSNRAKLSKLCFLLTGNYRKVLSLFALCSPPFMRAGPEDVFSFDAAHSPPHLDHVVRRKEGKLSEAEKRGVREMELIMDRVFLQRGTSSAMLASSNMVF